MAARQPELTLLVVGRHGARLAGLRLQYTGETCCPASAADLSELLDRRPADAVIFLSHGDLAHALLDYLKRRGKPLPATVLSLDDGLGESNPPLAAALRRIAEAADPRDLLAQLFEAVGAAQPPPGAEPHPPVEIPEEPPSQPKEPVGVPRPSGQADLAHRLQVVLEHRLGESSDT